MQHKYKKHKKTPGVPKSPGMLKQPPGLGYCLTGLDKLDSPKSVYLSDDQVARYLDIIYSVYNVYIIYIIYNVHPVPGLLLLPHQQHVRPALATPGHILVFHQHSEGGAHGVPGGEGDINITIKLKIFH